MAYEHKDGQGSMFRNEKQNDRQPDFKGSIMIGGVLYNVSAWKRTSQNGREYISLQAEERAAAAPRFAPPQPAPSPSFVPGDIPAPGLEDIPVSFGEDLPF